MKNNNLNVLYEDNHLLIVEKPRNMLVQADRTKDIDLLTLSKQYLVKKYNKPGDAFLGLVHRIDRPVGGVVLFGKTSKGASRISNEIRLNKFKRNYQVIVHGPMSKKKATVTDYLVKNNKTNTSYVTNKSTTNAKKAVLDYEVLGRDEEKNLTLLSVNLHTGRSHQIRVQLANLGHPIYGDQRYGQEFTKPGEQIALWAHQIEVKHPTKDEQVICSVQTPNEYPWTLFK